MTATQHETRTHVVELAPADLYRRDNYGVLMESTTVHDVTGRGVHNPGYPHRIEVWENRPSTFQQREHGYTGLVTPWGDRTEERYSVLTSAQAVVIAARPDPDRPSFGPALAVGDVVDLTIHGYSIGRFTLTAADLRDPRLIPLDTTPDNA